MPYRCQRQHRLESVSSPDHWQGRVPDAEQQQGGQQAAQTVQGLIQRDDGLPAVVPDDLPPCHAFASMPGRLYCGTMAATASAVSATSSMSS